MGSGAGIMKFQPGQPCCEDICEIDKLLAETAFTTDVIRPAEHPQSPYPAWLQAEVKAAVGDTLKLFLAWDESDPGDGMYIEWTPADGATAGTLKLFRKDGTQLGTTLQLLCADAAYWHLITSCYDPDTQEFTACFDARDSRGYVVRGQCVSATVPTGFTAGTKAGYGGAGNVRNYKYDRLWYFAQPPCPTIDTTRQGDDTPASSSITTWAVDGPLSPLSVNVNVYNPLTGTLIGYFSWSNTENTAQDFEDNVNLKLATVATIGETWTIDAVLTTDYYGINTDRMTATASGDLANVELQASAWITIDGEPANFSQYYYTRGSPGPVNEIQQLATLGDTPFTLTFGGNTTSDLPATSTAAEIQSALEALSSIGTGNVTVTGSNPWSIEFIGDLAEQNVAEIVATSDGCCIEDNTGDYYYDPQTCPRTYCHHCGSPSCTVVSESFAGIEGTGEAPGDMPCGWDADGTDWRVVAGKATGNGEVCHKFDTTGGSYHVSASFDLGHLETQGDLVTVSLTHGDTTHSLTVTRVAGIDPGDPDRLKYDWVPSEFASTYGALGDGSVTLTICPYHLCNNTVQAIVESVVTPGAVCVSITQPTMTGHEDASLTSLSITKSKEMDDDCPECQCTTTCADFCLDSTWPSGWLAELTGLESACCDVSAMNKGYYVNQYTSPCLSTSCGDDGLGVANPTDGTECIKVWGAAGIWYNEVAIWLASGECPVEVSVGLYPASDFSLYPWSWRANYAPPVANPTHAIVVSVTRKIHGGLGVIRSHWGKYYASVTDCKNLVDEELDFLTSDGAWRVTVGADLFGNPYAYGIEACNTPIINPHPTIPGRTVDIWLRVFGSGCHFWNDPVLGGYIMVLDSTHSASKIKLTAL